MREYNRIAKLLARKLTDEYSTSFGWATKLFDRAIRQDIYNIYGFVRIADEIVDTYEGADRSKVLDAFEAQMFEDLARGYSTNPILQAFISTANKADIGQALIKPFLASMRMDIRPPKFTQVVYETYIYGSAEVVGLMCLKVFCQGNAKHYTSLQAGAQSLGAAFQKINFLRDLSDDYQRLGRYYFPTGSFQDFDAQIKKEIVADIRKDFEAAKSSIAALPPEARKAVVLANLYYVKLLDKLDAASVEEVKTKRLRISNGYKLWLLVRVNLGLS